nr:BlaI/MecI/CopY family transcriptional regulator [Candidatus Electrothrix aestuarii]
MAKTDLTRQQKEVLKILADNPQGVDVRQIIHSLQAPPHKRTVQRWLTALAAEGHISVVGKGRATLYRLPTDQHDKLPPPHR